MPVGGAALVELTSWASFAAAREVGGWIPVRQDRTPGEDTSRRPPHAGVEHGRSGPVDRLADAPLPKGGTQRD